MGLPEDLGTSLSLAEIKAALYGDETPEIPFDDYYLHGDYVDEPLYYAYGILPCKGQFSFRYFYLQRLKTGILTSLLYPIYSTREDMLGGTASLLLDSSLRELINSYTIPEDSITSVSAFLLDGTLKDIYNTYTTPVEDSILSNSAFLSDGTLQEVLLHYDAPIEEFLMGSSVLLGGLIDDYLVDYTVPKEEYLTTNSLLTDGSLVDG